MARVYSWVKAKRIALCFCALALLGAGAGLWALGGDGEPWPWPYGVGHESPEPDVLSFAAAKADVEWMTGEEVDMVGTAGCWATVTAGGELLVPLDWLGGQEPPQAITVDLWIQLDVVGAGGISTVATVPYFLYTVWGGMAVYFPQDDVTVDAGSPETPDPELSAGLAQSFAAMGENGSLSCWPSVHAWSADVPGFLEPAGAIIQWHVGANFLYQFKAPPNQPPEAVASADPMVVAVGQPVTFSGEGSSDPDEDPLTYFWDFRDGGWSTDKDTTHTYTQPDTYGVTLTVHDSESGSDTAEVDVMAVETSFDRNPVLVGVAKTKIVTATISPSAGYAYVSFSTADPAVATVEPTTATGPVQQLQVSGLKKGVTTLDARVNGEICGSVIVKVGHIDFVRLTPNPGYLLPGEQTTFTAIGFGAVQGYPTLPWDYAPDLATPPGAELRFVTPQGVETRGIYLGPVKGRWKLEGGPNAEAFIPPNVPSENVSTVEVEAAAHAAGDISPYLFFYLANGDGTRGKLTAPGIRFLKFGTSQVITKVVTGYSMPANKSTLSKKITVSVTPAKDAVNVKFTVTGQKRVRFNVIKKAKDLAKGLLTVEISGQSATPANKPNGDTALQAKLGAKAFTLNVVVAVPKHNAHVVAGKTEHTNDFFRNPFGDGKNYLGTYHIRRTAISVSDQFNKALDPVYNGARLEERFDNLKGDRTAFPAAAIGRWAVMNAVPVPMTNGKFDDPMGTTSLDLANPNPAEKVIQKWLKGPPPQTNIKATKKGSADMKLRIAGHQLDEVFRRQVQIAPKDTVNVTDTQNP